MTDVITVHGLRKEYRDFTLKGINLTLPAGTIMGLVGANGAGKSTTLCCLLGLTEPTAGEIRIFGKDPGSDGREIRERIGVVFDECNFHGELTPRQIGKVLSGVYRGWDGGYYADMLRQLGLPDKKRIKEFSRGMTMKLSLAAAMSHHPDLLILDEPTGGLDPVVRGEILDLFLDFIQDEHKSILLSSHILSDLERVADYIVLIDRGELVLAEEKDTLLAEYGVLKGSEAQLKRVNPDDLIRVHRNQFGFEALVKPAEVMRRKYADMLVDPADVEDIMRFVAGKERVS